MYKLQSFQKQHFEGFRLQDVNFITSAWVIAIYTPRDLISYSTQTRNCSSYVTLPVNLI